MVGIDYLTKWVEAETLTTITKKNMQSFVWKNIVYRYGIPRVLVSDNEKQFDNNAFRDFFSQLGIKNHYSSLAHPQANGQVKVTNRSLLKIIKTRLEGEKGIWLEELPSHMGVQDDGKDTYKRDTISTSIWKRRGHSS